MEREKAARLAGWLYLALVPLGIFSFAYVPAALLVRGDSAATCANLNAREGLFRAGVASHLASQVLVVFLALALLRVFDGVGRWRAIAMAVLACLCVSISFAAEIDSLAAIEVLGGGDGGSLSGAQRCAHAVGLLAGRTSGILIAQIFWGLWLVPLASLIFRSGFLPRWLAVGISIAAAGYLFDSASHLLAPGGVAISPFTSLGEIPLPLWLVAKGAAPGRRQ